MNASSEEGFLAVNGMSYQARDGRNANSAMIVTVRPEDFGGGDVLAGVEFQRRLERAAYRAAGGKIPVQLLADFQKKQRSRSLGEVEPSNTRSSVEMSAGFSQRSFLPLWRKESLAVSISFRDFPGETPCFPVWRAEPLRRSVF